MTKKNFLNNALLHHLSLQSPNPEGLSKFYSYTIGMEKKAITHQKKSKWMCFGNDRRIIFSLGEKKKLDFAAFSLKDTNSLNDFKEIVLSNRVEIADFETPFFEKGSFSVKDPDGNVLVFGLSNNKEGIAYSSTYKDSIYGPLQHLTFKSKNVERFEKFYEEKLGFFVSDRVMKDNGDFATSFLTSNHEHHTIACFKADIAEIDHHSYETGEWNRIKDWCDSLEKKGIQLKWGPGRHGPGNNLFIFIEDPDTNWIEISAELEIIHDREVRVWKHEPKTLNLWGPHSIMRS